MCWLKPGVFSLRVAITRLGFRILDQLLSWKPKKHQRKDVHNFASGFGILVTLQGTNISYLGKRKIIFKSAFLWDMLGPRRVTVMKPKVSNWFFSPTNSQVKKKFPPIGFKTRGWNWNAPFLKQKNKQTSFSDFGRLKSITASKVRSWVPQ